MKPSYQQVIEAQNKMLAAWQVQSECEYQQYLLPDGSYDEWYAESARLTAEAAAAQEEYHRLYIAYYAPAEEPIQVETSREAEILKELGY